MKNPLSFSTGIFFVTIYLQHRFVFLLDQIFSWDVYVHPDGHEVSVIPDQATHCCPETRVLAVLKLFLIAVVSEIRVVKLFLTASNDMVARSKTLLGLVVKKGYERESLLELAVPTEEGAVHDV